MRARSFRLKSPTIGIRVTDNTAVVVSAGEAVAVSVDLPLGDSDMVAVNWSGQPLKMFARDIRERGEEQGGAFA
jgi:hypothetical protein